MKILLKIPARNENTPVTNGTRCMCLRIVKVELLTSRRQYAAILQRLCEDLYKKAHQDEHNIINSSNSLSIIQSHLLGLAVDVTVLALVFVADELLLSPLVGDGGGVALTNERCFSNTFDRIAETAANEVMSRSARHADVEDNMTSSAGAHGMLMLRTTRCGTLQIGNSLLKMQ